MTNLWTVCYFTLGITLTGGMLLLFKKIFQDKLSARWHYLVWLVLLVRAVLPGNVRLFSTGFSLNNLWMEGMKRIRGFVEMGRDSLLSTPFGMGGGDLSLLKDAPVGAWSVTDRLFAVYLAGVAAVLLYDIVIYGKLRREIGKGREASPALKEKIRATEKKYDLPRQERVKVCEGLETPFLCGFLRPVLVIPVQQEETIDEKVLLHEMLHLKHHDVLVNFALHLLQALQWFNPFVYGLCRVIRNDSEALCDQRALERLEGEEKREYGLLLLGMADHRCASRIGTTSMANGAKNIKTRVRRIADFGRVPKGAAFATACITVMLCLASVSFAYEPKYFDTSGVENRGDLERLLEEARYFEVSSPEMAINIYMEALQARDLVKMALIVPNEIFDEYKTWALEQYGTVPADGAQLLQYAEPDYLYGFYTHLDLRRIYINPFSEDGSVMGIFRFQNLSSGKNERAEELHYFRLQEENGWKLKMERKEYQKNLDVNLDVNLDYEILSERLRKGECTEVGDWRYTDAKWCEGWSSWNQYISFFNEPKALKFSEDIQLYTNHGILLEYIGENLETEGNRTLVFYLCPVTVTDEEIWDSPNREMLYAVETQGSSSNGSAYCVKYINQDWKGIVRLQGDLYAGSIKELTELLDTPYELRIYTQQGERLETFPLKGGAPYEK